MRVASKISIRWQLSEAVVLVPMSNDSKTQDDALLEIVSWRNYHSTESSTYVGVMCFKELQDPVQNHDPSR